MTHIEHLFLDLDGTLIGSSGDVKPSVWAALEPLRGVVGLSVCTGRTRGGVAQRVAQQLDPDGLHIFENGGMIAPASGPPAQVSKLAKTELTRLASAAMQIDATLEFYTPDGIFVSRLDADCQEHARALEIEVTQANLAHVIARHDVMRAHWIMRASALEAVLAVELFDAEIGVASSPVLPQMVFASITPRGVSKGSAAAELASRVGASLADCVGIGDAEGDVPLLEVVGHPYVVANSPETLRQRFPMLGDVDEDGIEELLGQIATTMVRNR